MSTTLILTPDALWSSAPSAGDTGGLALLPRRTFVILINLLRPLEDEEPLLVDEVVADDDEEEEES